MPFHHYILHKWQSQEHFCTQRLIIPLDALYPTRKMCLQTLHLPIRHHANLPIHLNDRPHIRFTQSNWVFCRLCWFANTPALPSSYPRGDSFLPQALEEGAPPRTSILAKMIYYAIPHCAIMNACDAARDLHSDRVVLAYLCVWRVVRSKGEWRRSVRARSGRAGP